jgi:hypothetical protein
MKYILFLLSCSLLLASCSDDFFSQTIKIDPPEYDKQLSFHLLLDSKDTDIRLTMTRNYGILENVEHYEDWFVKGATAELYENGQKWLTLTPLSDDSSFILTAMLPHPFQAGSKYEVRAAHPDFPSVNAIQVVPADFQVDSARIRYNAAPGELGEQVDLVEVFIRDEPGVKNYYEVTMSSQVFQTVYDPTTDTYDTVGVYTYPNYIDGFNDPNAEFGYGYSGLISDQFFDGQEYKFQLRTGSVDNSTFVTVRSVTEDYYKWSRTYQLNYDLDENPLVEPVSIFHNLQNGLGIFSISNSKRLEVH